MARKLTALQKHRAASADVEQPAEPEKTPNQLAAEAFAVRAEASGFPNAKAFRTNAVGGQPVRDGWVVNLRDEVTEMGLTACFYGRGHFHVYTEFKGWHQDIRSIGDAMLRMLAEQRPAA